MAKDKIHIEQNKAEEIVARTEPTHKYIFDNVVDAVMKFGTGYGQTIVVLTKADTKALYQGKTIAYTDGEYHHFITMENNENGS